MPFDSTTATPVEERPTTAGAPAFDAGSAKPAGFDPDSAKLIKTPFNDKELARQKLRSMVGKLPSDMEQALEGTMTVPEPVQKILDASHESVMRAPAGSFEEKAALAGEFAGTAAAQLTSPINSLLFSGGVIGRSAGVLPKAAPLLRGTEATINTAAALPLAKEAGAAAGEASVNPTAANLGKTLGITALTLLGGYGAAEALMAEKAVAPVFAAGTEQAVKDRALAAIKDKADRLARASAAEAKANNQRAADFLKARAEEHAQVAADLEAQLKQNQIGDQESTIREAETQADLDRIQLDKIADRPGESKREKARILSRMPEAPKVDEGAIPETANLSAQAARVAREEGEPLPGEATATPPPKPTLQPPPSAERSQGIVANGPEPAAARPLPVPEAKPTVESKLFDEASAEAVLDKIDRTVKQSVEGTPAEPSAKDLAGGIFVSPNKGNIDLPTAVKNLDSDEHRAFHEEAAKTVPDAQVHDGIGDWSDGAENTLAVTYHGKVTPAEVEQAAAKLGLAGEQKGVIHWVNDPNGKDVLWHVQFPKGVTIEQARQALADAGVEFRTLIPSKNGTTAMVFDKGAELLDKIAALESHETKPSIQGDPVTGDFLGADSREAAAAVYRQRLGAAEESGHQAERGEGRGNPPAFGPESGAVRLPAKGDLLRGGRGKPGALQEGAAPQLASDKRLPGAVGKQLDLVHFSGRPGLTAVDPKFFGKGHATPTDQQGGPKSYFFVKGSRLGGDKGLIDGPGKSRYEATVSGNRIYDLNKDPLDILSEPNREKRDDILKDEGYAGAVVETQDGRHVVMLFEPVKVRDATNRSLMGNERAGSIRGAVDPGTMIRLASSGAGAAYGAATGDTPEDRIRRAAEFALVGGFGGHYLARGVEKLAEAPSGALAEAARAAKQDASAVLEQARKSTLPMTAKASPESANAVVRYASSPTAAKAQSRWRTAEVLGDKVKDDAFAKKLGAVMIEDRLRGIKQGFVEAAREAAARGDKQAAQDLTAKANNVTTVVGMKDSPFKTAQELRAAEQDPAVLAAIERHKDYVQQLALENHLATGGQKAREGPLGSFVNLGIPEEVPAVDKGTPSARSGDLTNTMQRRSAFSHEAEGTAEQYDFDYRNMAKKMVEKNYERAQKRAMDDQLVKDGLAVVTELGPDTMPPKTKDGLGWTQFPLEPRSRGEAPRNLWVRSDIAPEYRQAANVTGPIARLGLLRMANWANRVQLTGLTDPIYHIANIETALAMQPRGKNSLTDRFFGLPGVNIVDAVRRTAVEAKRVLSNDPAVLKDIAELARIGALRPEHEGFVAFVDKAGRLAMDRIYQQLANRGLAANTEMARREFSNQIGQYNARLMPEVQRILKESGWAPFIVAGKNFNRLAMRSLFQQPGFSAASKGAYARMVAENLLGTIISAAAIPAALNYSTTGKMLGREGVPVGAIDTGKDDSQGSPIYVDPLKWIGMRRGLRLTGLNAVLNGLREDKGWDRIGGEALKDMLNGLLHPYLGPAPTAAFTAVTGKSPSGFQEAKVLNPRATFPTLSQAKENVKAAVLGIQPMVSAYESRKDLGMGPAKAVLASFGGAVGVGSRAPKTEEGGRAAQALEEQQRSSFDSTTKAREEYKRLVPMSSDERRKELARLKSEEPEVYDKMAREIEYQSKGYTDSDRAISQLNVQDGHRARFIMSELRQLPDRNAKVEYLRGLLQKKLITGDVADQLVAAGLGQVLNGPTR